MKGRIISILAVCFVMFFMFAGCAKKEEPVTKQTRPTQETQEAQVAQKPQAERPTPQTRPITEERVLFSFEDGDNQGWEIPDWALDKEDHIAKTLKTSEKFAAEGKSSLEIECDFPGGAWTTALVELEQYLDLSPYRQIVVDVYTPKDTPLGLRAKIILTVGENWKFTEMTRSVPLVPGEWTTIKASIEPGSYDWKRIVSDEAFRQDIRKIVVRIESNKRPVYKGPIYIDNVRVGK